VNIALFGAAGFVGTNVLETLRLDGGPNVIASDIIPTLRATNSKARYTKADIIDGRAVLDVVQDCDVVINLAAGGVNASLNDPLSDMKINIEGTLNILEAARKKSVKRVIYSSASSVVGAAKYVPTDEDHPCFPSTPYAVAKLCCENYVRLYHELYGLQYVIFRFFNVYGPFERTGLAPVTTFMTSMMNGSPVKITGDGSQTRDFVFVKDVAHFIRLATATNTDHALLNLGTGVPTSILQLVGLCAETVGRKPDIQYQPRRAGDISNFYADVRRLRETFGEVPHTPLKEGLKQTYNWLLEQRGSGSGQIRGE